MMARWHAGKQPQRTQRAQRVRTACDGETRGTQKQALTARTGARQICRATEPPIFAWRRRPRGARRAKPLTRAERAFSRAQSAHSHAGYARILTRVSEANEH